MTVTKKAPVLRKRKREQIETELESGPGVAERRDLIMKKMLSMPPRPHSDMKIGRRAKGSAASD
jgi:hypothetical protein